MDRRIALKNLGLGLGYVVAAPTFLSVVQSCKNIKAENWVPEMLSPEQGNVLSIILDIILPKTEDSPSATEAKAHIFIDKYLSISLEEEQKTYYKMRLNKFMAMVREKASKGPTEEVTDADIEVVLAYALNPSDTQREENNKAIKAYIEAVKNDETADLDSQAATASIANEIRSFGIHAYKNSELVAKNHLAYNPIPGTYIPCASVEELTGGKAWYQ